jgi:hypothetical protein
MRTVFLDCGPVREPTAATIDQIARLKLEARRSGCDLELANANSDLEELIQFCGLGGVLGLESEGHSEQREQSGGIEEERQLDDPSVL